MGLPHQLEQFPQDEELSPAISRALQRVFYPDFFKALCSALEIGPGASYSGELGSKQRLSLDNKPGLTSVSSKMGRGGMCIYCMYGICTRWYTKNRQEYRWDGSRQGRVTVSADREESGHRDVREARGSGEQSCLDSREEWWAGKNKENGRARSAAYEGRSRFISPAVGLYSCAIINPAKRGSRRQAGLSCKEDIGKEN